MRFSCGLVALTLLLAAVPARTSDLPNIREQNQFNAETKVWIDSVEAVKASGNPVSFYNDGSETAQAQLTGILGVYLPLDKVEYAWIEKDGTFGLKFKKKHRIDIPLKNGGYIRVKFDDSELRGVLLEAKTIQKGIPLKVMAFGEPRTMQIDKLGPNRKSKVSKMGKILGLLPHIVALAYLEVYGEPYAAPQLDGMGASENPRLIMELLRVDDTLLPERFLANNE
jgi:hypothetical protein